MVEEIILKAIRGLEHELEKFIKRLFHHFPHHPECQRHKKVRQVLYLVINNNKLIIMEKLRVDKGFHINAALINKDTNEVVAGATKVLKSRTSSDPSIVTIDENGDAQPQQKGACQITEVNDWTYEEGGEQVTTTETTVVDVQVVDAPFGQLQIVTFVPFDKVPAPAANA